MEIKTAKEKLYGKITDIFPQLIELNTWLYENPELSAKEFNSAAKICDYLEDNQFQVERNVADLETAFVAKFKISEGGPKIGFLAEYDALPEVGHGCAHNIIASSCVGAAVALSKSLEEPSEIIVFGTPDEEFDGGKIVMAEAGIFAGIDAAMQVHADSDRSYIGGSSTPHQTMLIDFHGVPAHTAFNPTEGISALNAVLITFMGLNAMQQYLKPGTRIPATITNGGGAPNLVPKFAQIRIHITTLEPDYLDEVVQKIENCARGGALATGAKVEIWKSSPYKKLYSNETLTQIFRKNVEEQNYTLIEPPAANAATDVGNVSWECPTALCFLTLESPGIPLHTEELAAATVEKKGEKMLKNAIMAMASTALEIITDQSILKKIKEDFKKTKEMIESL